MTDETFEAVETVPVEELTAAPETVETETPEANEAPKTFTQEELDAIVGKRLAREQRKWERAQAERVQISEPAGEVYKDDYDSDEAYTDALAAKKAAELLAQMEAERARKAIVTAYQEREEEALDKYDDFQQVTRNPNLSITNDMAETIMASDVGPDLLYHLGSNPREADRISRLSPLLQAKEIGKLEAKLATAPPARKTTNAPAPLNPVTARTTGTPVYDTTDPRSIKTMTTSEWIAADRQRQMKRLGG